MCRYCVVALLRHVSAAGASRLERGTKRQTEKERERVDRLLPLKMKEASLWVSFRVEGECYHSCALLV